MATLAFESPEKCGIEAYEKVFSMDRWLALEEMFLKTFNDVYGMHDPPSLCIALHAGLSTLNTRACHLTRDANLKAKLARSGTRGKRPRREGDESTGAGADDDEDSGNESDEMWFKPSSNEDGADRSSQRNTNCAGGKRRKHSHTDSTVPICPACSEVGSQLCSGLPFAYHPHSRLVCRVTQSVMDEHNPPLVLPNGRVYSKRGIELLTRQHRRHDQMRGHPRRVLTNRRQACLHSLGPAPDTAGVYCILVHVTNTLVKQNIALILRYAQNAFDTLFRTSMPWWTKLQPKLEVQTRPSAASSQLQFA